MAKDIKRYQQLIENADDEKALEQEYNARRLIHFVETNIDEMDTCSSKNNSSTKVEMENNMLYVKVRGITNFDNNDVEKFKKIYQHIKERCDERNCDIEDTEINSKVANYEMDFMFVFSEIPKIVAKKIV